MTVDPRAVAIIREFEGCRLEAYLDVAGIPTIGYGSTFGVKMGDKITQVDADALLLHDIEVKSQGLKDFVRGPLTASEEAALLSLAFNIGLGALKGSTAISDINNGDKLGGIAEFARWHRAGGKRVKGLLRRRAREILLALED